jgi:hypothetical protein
LEVSSFEGAVREHELLNLTTGKPLLVDHNETPVHEGKENAHYLDCNLHRRIVQENAIDFLARLNWAEVTPMP